jgi:drug/metabolite transporter (DMT)-like permease
VFGERVGPAQIAGSLIILAGILMLGTDEASQPLKPPEAPSAVHPGSH